MITKGIETEYDKSGNLIYYKDIDTGYWESNTYNDKNKLIRSESHFPRGEVEIEHYSGK